MVAKKRVHKKIHRVHHRNKETLKKAAFTLVIAFAIVLFWRGAWGLADMYLFPHDEAFSYVLSLVISVGILYATHYIFKAFT